MIRAALSDSTLVKRALRFGVTGIGVTLLHVVVATGLIEMASLRPAWANGAAFIVATLTSYLFNTLWSFSQTPAPANLSRFVAVSLLGLGIAMAVSGAAEIVGLPYWLGIAGVVLTVPPTTFLLHAFWTYRT
jgi:putative flippase GtrA